MEFTQNDWGQHDIINTIKLLTKLDSNMIHDVIPKKYWKYPYNTILKHVNVLAKVNKSHLGHLHSMKPHEDYSITIYVPSMTPMYISHERKE